MWLLAEESICGLFCYGQDICAWWHRARQHMHFHPGRRCSQGTESLEYQFMANVHPKHSLANLKVYSWLSFCLNSAGTATIPSSLAFAWWLFDDNHLQIEHGWESNPGFNTGLFTRISLSDSPFSLSHIYPRPILITIALKTTLK